MSLITVDYETWWTKEHSLSKMLPMTYVMHPQTQIISCAVKIDDEPTEVWFGEDNIAEAFRSIQWDDAMVIGHNMSGFDAMIHAWRFGIHPKMWGCTLAMAKPIHAITVGNSLAKLVEHYQLGVKDNSVLVATQGKRLEDFTADELAQMSHYNKADTDQCFELFKRLRPHFSRQELWHIDATIRMLVEPKFVVDKDMLGAALLGERNRKYEAVMNLAELLDLDIEGDTSKIEEEVTTQLASAAKFSEILENRGVPVPMKDSPSTEGKQIPALAKTDPGFIALQEHDDDIVAAAALARLAIKSTILETRINTFLEVADTANGMLPVPLNYCGATTTGRDCLAEGSLVRTMSRDGFISDTPIEFVTTDHRVWDGDDWVSHEGVVFSGDKDVIEWDGVTATPEHIVWVERDKKVQLGYAKENKLTLWEGDHVRDIQTNIPVG